MPKPNRADRNRTARLAKRQRRVLYATAIAIGALLAANGASAALFDVVLDNSQGPHIEGQVDTLTDTFTITSWTENPLGPIWWTPSDLPRTYDALTTSGTFDVPDDWDGTIGTDWGFINPLSLSASGWSNGTFSPGGPTLIRDGWGGGVDGSGAIDVSSAQNSWRNVPFGPTSVGGVGFGTVTITPVPEPGALSLLGVGLAALAVSRRRPARPSFLGQSPRF